MNRYACAILGWTAEELVGRDWIKHLPAGPAWKVQPGGGLADLSAGGFLSLVDGPVLTGLGEERLVRVAEPPGCTIRTP